jgi:hypothetical protein
MPFLVPHPQDDDCEDYQEDLKWLKKHDLEFKGERRPAPEPYGPKACSWTAFSMTDDETSETLWVLV